VSLFARLSNFRRLVVRYVRWAENDLGYVYRGYIITRDKMGLRSHKPLPGKG
jgi:hypothetical protein